MGKTGLAQGQGARDGEGRRLALLLLAKSAFAAPPHREMERLARALARDTGAVVRACFSEQGQPSLRDALVALWAEAPDEIRILPLVLPMEPGFLRWLSRSVARWQAEATGPTAPVSIAHDVASAPGFAALLTALATGEARPVPPLRAPAPEAVLVPPQRRRVLVCEGGACNAAGATAIWAHLRNLQVRRNLRMTGAGTMTAKSTCLGPCALAPVVQVFPEGTWYGGVTEAAIDRIVDEHLLGDRIVERFAYHPTGRKQRLRPPATDPSSINTDGD